jgi:glycosyltransferase involved in cell wall biosynthesis
MHNLTIIIWAYNQEDKIADCLQSAQLLTKNIIIIDLESTDKTALIAKKMGAVVITHSNYQFVEPVRNFGIAQAKTEWIFILDADERITPELAEETKNQLTTPDIPATYFYLPRKNIFHQQQWLKHGGWWPDYQIRIINKNYFINWPEIIHSCPQIKGTPGYFKNPLLHLSHQNLEKMVNTTLIFENQEAELLFQAQKPVTTGTFFRKFNGELFRRLIKGGGFLDGSIGIIEGIYQAFSKTITYLFLYEKKNCRSL